MYHSFIKSKCILTFIFSDLPLDVTKWGVAEVVKFFQSKSECQVFAPILKEQEIDGPALLLLSHDSLVKCLDIKLGPALKVSVYMYHYMGLHTCI